LLARLLRAALESAAREGMGMATRRGPTLRAVRRERLR
jgi:hypothetical protein